MMKSGFKERLHGLLYGAGNYSVFYGRHAEGPELPRFATLGYQHSPGGRWCIGIDLQFLSHSLKICVYSLRVDVFDSDPVDARCSLALV